MPNQPNAAWILTGKQVYEVLCPECKAKLEAMIAQRVIQNLREDKNHG